MNPKEQKRFAVSQSILEIIERDGLKGVSHSRISRHSGVSRPWIYEYMGKDKQDLIQVAADVMASFFVRAHDDTLPESGAAFEARLSDGTKYTLECAVTYPVVVKLYYRFRHATNPLGKVIDKYEKHSLDYLVKCLVKVHHLATPVAYQIAQVILTIRMGFAHLVATSPTPKKRAEEAKKTIGFLYRQLVKPWPTLGNRLMP